MKYISEDMKVNIAVIREKVEGHSRRININLSLIMLIMSALIAAALTKLFT